jgi:hypothetical protein
VTVALAARRPRSPDGVVAVGALVAANGVVAILGARQMAVLALAGAVAVPAAIAVIRRPQRGVLVLAAIVPFDGLLLIIDHPGFVEGWKEAVVLALLGATCLAPARSRAPRRRLPGWVAPLGALIAVGAASAAVTGGMQALLGLKIGFFYVLIAAVVWRCPLTARDRDRLVTVLMVTGVVAAAVGVAQQLIGAERLNELGYEYNSTIRFSGGYLRSFSTFGQPFPFGFFLMLVLLVGAAHALEDPRRWRSRAFLVATPLLTLGMITSVVRAAWLGAVVGLLYLGITRHRALLLLAPVLVVSLLFLPSHALGAAFSSDSSQERVTGWSANLQRIVEHPLGEGIGSTGAAAERLRQEHRAVTDVYQPDNQYVKTGIELGPLAVWFLALVLAAAFSSAHVAARLRGGADGAFAAGVAAYVLAAAVASTMATFLEIFPLELFFWLLVAATAALGARRPATPVAAAVRVGWS